MEISEINQQSAVLSLFSPMYIDYWQFIGDLSSNPGA